MMMMTFPKLSGVMLKELDCGLNISLNSNHTIHFQTNTLGKGMNPFTALFLGLIISLLFFYKDSFGIN